jgi:hypothetical protein
MVRVPLELAQPTMRLAKPVCDAGGRVMAGSGSALTPSVLRLLRRLAIQSVVVTEESDVAGWEHVRPLAEEQALLASRIGPVVVGSPRATLRAALERRLQRRSTRLGDDDAHDTQTAGDGAGRPG